MRVILAQTVVIYFFIILFVETRQDSAFFSFLLKEFYVTLIYSLKNDVETLITCLPKTKDYRIVENMLR